MKKQSFAAFIATALIATATLSHATLVGMPSTVGTEFATFDTFTAGQPSFVGNTPSQSSTGLFTATMDNTFTPGPGAVTGVVAGFGDRLYSGSGPTPSAFSLTFDGIASGTITTLSLQLKFTPPANGTAADFFTVALTGAGAGTQVFLGSSLEGSNNFQIYQWTWTGLNISSGAAFEITAISSSDHVSLDTARVTNTAAQAIPEPSTYALIALGLGAVVIASRVRRARA